MLDVLLDTLLDCLKVLPFLFLAYLLIEYVEHRASDKFIKNLTRVGRGGPALGALLGLVPQCGFSVAAANLFASRLITAGTFAAVFIATSDEAIPLLLAGGDFSATLKLLGVKFVMGAVVGFLVDIFVRKKPPGPTHSENHMHDHCEHGIFRAALIHTLKSLAFLFATVLVFNLAVFWIGDDAIAAVLLRGSLWQPVLAAVIGLVPSCAPAIILTQLYLDGVVSFGALLAALTTNAGIGLAALFRANRSAKQNLLFVALFVAIGILAGLLFSYM